MGAQLRWARSSREVCLPVTKRNFGFLPHLNLDRIGSCCRVRVWRNLQMTFFGSTSRKRPWPQKSYRRSAIRALASSEVYDRQEMIPGYHTEALRRTSVLGIGAGGLGSYVYAGLI